MNSSNSSLILEYDLIKNHILPEIKEGIDTLIGSKEVDISHHSNNDIKIFYEDICKIILDTMFD